MIRFISESDVVRLLKMRDAIALVEDAARALGNGEAMNFPRQRPRTETTTMHVLPSAYTGKNVMGLKAYTTGKHGSRFWYMLFDANGTLIALVHANNLGQIRTGAASAVATRYMAREGSNTLGIIGTGFQARSQLEAVCMVRDIKTVKAWGRTRENLEEFAEEMTAKTGVKVEPVKTAREAVEGLDIVITMTGASQPVLEGAWVSPGTHLNVTGSNRITAREVDGETIARAGIVAVEDLAQAKLESGDLKIAVDERKFQWEKMVTLGEIVAGKIPGRHDESEITLFDSLGIGLWDAVAARFVYDKAVSEHVGIEVPVDDPPVKVRKDRSGR